MATATERTLVLDHERVQRKLQRIAHQLHEDNFEEKTLVFVGVAPRGTIVAERLARTLGDISGIHVELVSMELDKNDPLQKAVKLSCELSALENKVVILVDDVLMSGRTLMYGATHLLGVPLKKMTTVVLVDRRHRSFPIRADIVGLTLCTTLQEHISVELGKKDGVYLS